MKFQQLGDQIANCTIAAIDLAPLFALTAAAESIVVYGASGNIGAKIVTEALNRGHVVIGVSRNPAKLTVDHANFSAVSGDVTSVESMLEIIVGSDAVVISVQGDAPDNKPEETTHNQAALTFIAAAKQLGAEAPRVIQVGGATTLTVNGTVGLENPDFPFPVVEGSAFYAMLWGHWHALENYRAADDIKWTVVSPPKSIFAGERTEEFRLGENEMIVDDNGESVISQEDFAVAIIDEIESPSAIGKRITVGY